MTALSDLLLDAKNAGRNVDHWVGQAANAGHKINRATVYKYLDGDGAKSPTESTLKALAFVFDLDVRVLRTAVGKPAGELGPYKPTDEADRLRQDQRDALDQLIKSIVREGEVRVAPTSNVVEISAEDAEVVRVAGRAVEERKAAARRAASQGRQKRKQQDAEAEASQDEA